MMRTDLIPFDTALRPFRRLWMNAYPYAETEGWVPPADISETDKSYIVTMEIPGIDMKKLDIYYSDGLLSVKGEKTKEDTEGESCYCMERFSGGFERSLRVPGNIAKDKIDATYRDGVLKVMIPKSEEGVQKIQVH
jgi:HSP20 family protein